MNSKSFASAHHTIAGPYRPFQTSILPTTHRYLAVIINFHFQVWHYRICSVRIVFPWQSYPQGLVFSDSCKPLTSPKSHFYQTAKIPRLGHTHYDFLFWTAFSLAYQYSDYCESYLHYVLKWFSQISYESLRTSFTFMYFAFTLGQ